ERTCTPNTKPSVEVPPTLELKPLPPKLEYAFLKKDSKLPIIVSLELTNEQKQKLLKVLRKHKGVITWKMSDIKGINTSFRTHKILMEERHHPMVQPQKRLHPNMKDVVKAKVIKLLDTGLIYPNF